MSKVSRVISFGASITYGSELPDQSYTWSSIIAQKMGLDYLCLAKENAANSGISRSIISNSDEYKDDLVLAMWTSSTRYEFRVDNRWENVSPWSEQTGFTREWYRGPGGLEYTEVVTTMKEIVLASQFLERTKLPYIFVLDNDELRTSHTWNLADEYIQTLKVIMPWDNIVWFDGTGFLEWCREKNYRFINTHPGVEAHQACADYLMINNIAKQPYAINSN
jgi:hypothetical protein